MRKLRHMLLGLGLAVAVAAPMVVTSDAQADARTDARTHYQAGVKFYNTGDYKSAIREFSAAHAAAPADLNNYNLALCYDKLGDPEPAVQYYKAYLDKVPNTDKRAEIEASISRLDAAAKSVAAKKAEEARKADEAKKTIDAKRADDQRRADEELARKKAEDDAAAAKKAADEAAAKTNPDDTKLPIGPMGPIGTGVGSTGTPGTGTVRPSGDAQIDRIQHINIDQVRDQRVGGAASGIPDRKTNPGRTPANPRVAMGAGTGGDQQPVANGRTGAPTNPQVSGTDPATNPADKPKPTPVYKKWWFWAVVAVSAYVVYSIANDNSRSSTARFQPLPTPGAPTTGGGMTLMRF